MPFFNQPISALATATWAYKIIQLPIRSRITRLVYNIQFDQADFSSVVVCGHFTSDPGANVPTLHYFRQIPITAVGMYNNQMQFPHNEIIMDGKLTWKCIQFSGVAQNFSLTIWYEVE